MKNTTDSIICQYKIRGAIAAMLAALCLAGAQLAPAQSSIAPHATDLQTPNPKPAIALAPPPQSAAQPATFLAWEVDSKKVEVQPGELAAHFTFYVTNVSSQVVVITNLQRSCGCTDASMPAQPWTLAPGTNGPIRATIDLRGKMGAISKMLTVNSTAGSKILTLNVNIPAAANAAANPNPSLNLNPNPPLPSKPVSNMDRERNQQASTQDRQVVFKGECASCHATPTVGKFGHELYQAGCAICHDAEHRAQMVPDLHSLKPALDAEQWKQWITASKPGSMMPAFAKVHGGPLSDEQIVSLVDYLTRTMPKG
jgi:mono/diheme cytochrome c family protein